MSRLTLQNKWVITALAVLATLMWGSAYPGIKISYTMFGLEASLAVDKMLFAGIRFLLAGVVIVVVMSIVKKRFLCPKPANLLGVSVMGLLQTGLQYTFFYVGLGNTDGSKSAIISGTSTIFAVLFAAMAFKDDPLNLRKIFAVLLAFAAIVVVNINQEFGSLSFRLDGEVSLLIASIAFAMGSVASRIVTRAEDASTASGYQLIVGGLMLFVGGIAFGGEIPYVTSAGVWMMVYLVLLSSIAYLCWTLLLSANPVSKIMIYYYLVPVFGVILSAVFLGESVFDLPKMAALLMVCLSIHIVYGRDNAGGAST